MRHNYQPDYLVADRYEVGGLLEDRGYCALYQGRDMLTGQHVLLKNDLGRSPSAFERFELERSRVIDHPGLARRLDSYWVGGEQTLIGNGSWQVFEWHSGSETLAAWLARHDYAVDPTLAFQLMIDVCRALEYLHTGHPPMIHAHVSPETILVWTDTNERAHAFLPDYGMTEVDPLIRVQSLQTGALRSGAPEQYYVDNQPGEQTDVYGVGATLFRLLTGQEPPDGNARLHGQQLPSVTALNPDLRPEEAQLIERAISVHPAHRHQTVAALRGELEQAVRDREPVTYTGLFWMLLILAIAVVAGVLWLASRGDTPDVAPPATLDPAALVTPGDTGGGFVIPPTDVPPTLPPPAPTADVAATLVAAEASYRLLAGPTDALLVMAAPGTQATAQLAGPLADFVVEALFVNPAAPPWDYGFAFRHNPDNHYRLIVTSDGVWQLIYREEDPDDSLFLSVSPDGGGALPALALGPGQTNRLRLTVVGAVGRLVVNGQPAAELDLGTLLAPGTVHLASGLRPEAPGVWSVAVQEAVVWGP